MVIRRFSDFTFAVAIIALFTGFLGCDHQQVDRFLDILERDQETEPPVDPEPSEGEIIIGVDLPLTGIYAEPYGLPMQRGFELAQEEINGSGILGDGYISFIVEDDESTVDGAVNAFNKLITDGGVSIITGLAVSTQGKQAFPIAQDNGVVCVSSVSSASGLSAIGDFIFRVPLTIDVLNPNGVRITQAALGYEQAALIYDESDVYSTDSNAVFAEVVPAHGVEVVATETFQGGDTDFTEQLTAIMNSGAEAIFISALSAEIPEIMIQARALGIPSSVRFIVPELSGDDIATAEDAAEGAISLTSWTSLADTSNNQAFVEAYRAAYGIEPEPWAAQSYATLHIIAEAIVNAGSIEAGAVRDALANITDFNTILGLFEFNDDGDAVYDPIVLVVTDGELALFE